MTREEKKTELRIIAAHLITVMEDCCAYRNRLENRDEKETAPGILRELNSRGVRVPEDMKR